MLIFSQAKFGVRISYISNLPDQPTDADCEDQMCISRMMSREEYYNTVVFNGLLTVDTCTVKVYTLCAYVCVRSSVAKLMRRTTT